MNINCAKLNHDKFSDIKKIVRQKGCNIAVISGSKFSTQRLLIYLNMVLSTFMSKILRRVV